MRFRVMFAAFKESKLRSPFSRLYLPMLMVSAVLISLLLVMVSISPEGQIFSCMGVFMGWCAFSLCCCPYPFFIKVFIRMYEFFYLLQLCFLAASVCKPEYSMMGPALALIVVNWLQMANLIGLSVAILLKVFYGVKCFNR